MSEPGHPHRHYRIAQRPQGAIYIPPEQWAEAAERRDGSWWEAWNAWLKALHSQGEVPPPAMGAARYPVLGEAPGDYVHQH